MDNQLPTAAPDHKANHWLPDAAATVNAITSTTMSELDEVFGKPSAYATSLIPEYDGASTMMIGDRLDTDMLFGKNAGVGYRVLVLSGFSNVDEHVPKHDGFFAESVVELKKAFE